MPSRLFSWLHHWLPEPESLGELQYHRDLAKPIIVVAQGDAFDFRIHASLTWRSNGIGWDRLQDRIVDHGPVVRALLRRKAAELAREHPPHHTRELQDELNRYLTQHPWQFERNGIALTCAAQVIVLPDEQIRESLQSIWQRRITMETEHELGQRRAELVLQLTEAWSATMEKLQDNPYTAHAAPLTEDAFADAFREMLAARGEASNNLIGLLRAAIHDHQKVGLYEFVETYDKALKAFQKQAGLVVPEPE